MYKRSLQSGRPFGLIGRVVWFGLGGCFVHVRWFVFFWSLIGLLVVDRLVCFGFVWLSRFWYYLADGSRIGLLWWECCCLRLLMYYIPGCHVYITIPTLYIFVYQVQVFIMALFKGRTGNPVVCFVRAVRLRPAAHKTIYRYRRCLGCFACYFSYYTTV